jgi:hypothetical protein
MLIVKQHFGMNFADINNHRFGNTWPHVFLYTAIGVILASLIFGNIGSSLRRIWSACKSWAVYAIRFISSDSSRQEDTKPAGVPENDDFNIGGVTSACRHRKTLPEDEPLPEGLSELWYYRRDSQQWYLLWIAILVFS